MNILVIHETEYLQKVTFEFQTLAELLAQRGHNVFVIDYEQNWHGLSLWQPKRELVAKKVYDYVYLIRPAFIKIPVLSRLSAFTTHFYTIKNIIEKNKIDAIILYSVPTNGLQTIYLAKQFGIPVIFRSIDILNQLVPKVFSGITKELERYVYKYSDIVLPINKGLADYVKDLGATKVRIVPLGVEKQFKPMEVSYLRHELGLDGKKIVVFVGTLPLFSGLDKVLRDFPKILAIFPEIRLIIVGDGKQRVELEKIIEKYDLKSQVLMMGYQKYEKIPDFINLADVCIMPFEICKATQDIFPTKVIQYLACGKPVISTKLKGLKDCQEIFFADNIVDGLIDYFKFPPYNNALDYVKKHDYDAVLNEFEEILSEAKTQS